MSKRVVGLILNLIVSVGIGLFAGEKFYQLFDKLVPAGAMTELMRTGSHTTYLFTGSLLGLVIFAWTAAAVWLGRFFPSATTAGTPASPAAAK